MRRVRMIAGGMVVSVVGIMAMFTHADEPGTKRKSADAEAEKATVVAALETMAKPEYDERGAMLRPEGYETWVFVGTSLGITYSEGAEEAKGPGTFHNVYMQPEAYEHYKATGEFPEKTVFVMTNQPATKKAGPDLINKRGHFAGAATGLEVSVKDSEHFADGWGYFLYSTQGPRKGARALPTSQCYNCHAEHGEDDHVFVQFYSVLEAVRKK